MKLIARQHVFEFPRPALIMGIVNLSGDSFSGDGLVETGAALAHARRLIAAGAEMIDIGAETARTNREAISEQEEADRLGPFVEQWVSSGAGGLLSINTWRPRVIEAVLPLGGDLVNDIGGFPTGENAALCARFGAALLIMHTVGEPKVPHTTQRYDDIMATLDWFFEEKLALAERAGLPREHVILDPGLDFAKQRPDNLRILRECARLQRFGRPVLLPISRKTFIGEVLGQPEPAARDAGTVACLVAGLGQGAQIFRVHHVRAAVQAARMVEAINEAGGEPMP